MITQATDTLLEQTLVLRQAIVGILKSFPEGRLDQIPPTWNNSARWHAGHLVLTPCLLTHGIAKEPLPVPEGFRQWFAKGTSPASWGNDTVPGCAELIDQILPITSQLFETFRDRMEDPFPEPYTTSVGVTLRNPGQALQFSFAHDGIHLGMLLALKRAL